MKLTVGFEQSVVMVILVATQEEAKGLNINVLSKKMKMNSSYLRKLARKLVEGNVLTSSTSRFSGYQLKHPVSEISLLDIFNAIEGEEPFAKYSGIIEQTFGELEKTHAKQKMGDVLHLLAESEAIYREKLKSITLNQLLVKDESNTLMKFDWIAEVS